MCHVQMSLWALNRHSWLCIQSFSSMLLTNSYLSLGGCKQMIMTGLLNLDVKKAEAAYPSLVWQWATSLPGKINFRRTNRGCVRKDRITFLPCLITPDHYIPFMVAFAS